MILVRVLGVHELYYVTELRAGYTTDAMCQILNPLCVVSSDIYFLLIYMPVCSDLLLLRQACSENSVKLKQPVTFYNQNDNLGHS